jgi:hypothetical protein
MPVTGTAEGLTLPASSWLAGLGLMLMGFGLAWRPRE